MKFNLNNIGTMVFRTRKYESREIINLISALNNLIRVSEVQKGDYVGICMNRCPEMVASILSCLQMNITYIPVDTELPLERIRYILKDCRMVISNGCTIEKMKEIFSDIPVVLNMDAIKEKNCISSGSLFSYPWDFSDVAYLIYTSGTTGKPKGVKITRGNLDNFINGFNEVVPITDTDRIICIASICFDIFFVEAILPLIKGATVILADEDTQKNPRLMMKLIAMSRANIIQLTPSKALWLREVDNLFENFKYVKTILIGAEILPRELLLSLQENTCAKIYNVYGPTETTIWACISDLTKSDYVNIGKPIKNLKIFILDEKCNIVKNGEYGQIAISGKGVGAGYYKDLQLTNKKFVFLPAISDEIVYLTGDWGRYLANGNLECIGRIDNQVKINGFRVELEEIESVMMEFKSIYRAVVCKIDKCYDRLIGFYLSSERVEEDEVRRFLGNKLPGYMIPYKFVHKTEFPMTNSGKIDRNRLVSDFNMEEKETKYISQNKGSSEKNKKIVDIIMENLSDLIDGDSGFTGDLTNIEIDSIKFINLVLALEEEFNIEFEDEMLLVRAFPTVDSMVTYVESKL